MYTEQKYNLDNIINLLGIEGTFSVHSYKQKQK
jgi:hypothetical protein